MTIKEFLEEYKVFYQNCVDGKTGLFNSFEKLKLIADLSEKKYFAFDRRKFYSRLISCTKENKNGKLNETDFDSLHFNSPEELDYWDNNYIIDNLRIEQLTAAFEKRIRLELDINQIDNEIETLDNEIKRLNNKLDTKPLDLDTILDIKQQEAIYNFLKSKKCFKSSVKIDEIYNLFSKDISTPNQPIKWKDDTRLLVYFFKTLSEEKFIQNNHWQSVIEKAKLFETKNNKPLTASNIAANINFFKDPDNVPEYYYQFSEFICNLNSFKSLKES